MRSNTFDVLIVGGGIVGLATAFELSRKHPTLKVLLVEKEDRIASHQTGRNSGVLHTGIYYQPGSLKAENCRRGRARMVEFCEREGIAHSRCGKIIVATEEAQLAPLTELERRARENGVKAHRAGIQELREIEPEVAGIGGLIVPDAGIVDFAAVAGRLQERAIENGCEIRLGQRIVSFTSQGPLAVAHTQNDSIFSRYIVNCGGLQSDRLAELGGAPTDVKIVPFRGEYFELNDEGAQLVRGLIYPVPRPEFPFLGVHFTRGIHGDVECGPNAVLNPGRETYAKGSFDWSDLGETLLYPGFLRLARKYYRAGSQELLRSLFKAQFVKAARQLIPKIQESHFRAAPAGIRAQAVRRDGSLVDDFLLHQGDFVLSVINAPSPAATSSLEIARTLTEHLKPIVTSLS